MSEIAKGLEQDQAELGNATAYKTREIMDGPTLWFEEAPCGTVAALGVLRRDLATLAEDYDLIVATNKVLEGRLSERELCIVCPRADAAEERTGRARELLSSTEAQCNSLIQENERLREHINYLAREVNAKTTELEGTRAIISLLEMADGHREMDEQNRRRMAKDWPKDHDLPG